MTYTFDLTVPPNTPTEEPLILDKKLIKGIVTNIKIIIPPGHVGLTGLSLYNSSRQIFPVSRNEWVRGNNIFIEERQNLLLISNDNIVSFYLYNKDDTYEHTFTVYLNMEDFEPVTIFDKINENVHDILGAITKTPEHTLEQYERLWGDKKGN